MNNTLTQIVPITINPEHLPKKAEKVEVTVVKQPDNSNKEAFISLLFVGLMILLMIWLRKALVVKLRSNRNAN